MREFHYQVKVKMLNYWHEARYHQTTSLMWFFFLLSTTKFLTSHTHFQVPYVSIHAYYHLPLNYCAKHKVYLQALSRVFITGVRQINSGFPCSLHALSPVVQTGERGDCHHCFIEEGKMGDAFAVFLQLSWEVLRIHLSLVTLSPVSAAIF